MTLHVACIPPEAPFLDTLAARWLDRHQADPSRGLILLPTRRAARALAESFLHLSGGRPMLLPRITALGALDETPLALAGALDLPPPVPQPRRLAALSRLILSLPEQDGGVRAADRAWLLAAELAQLMDEAEGAELSLADCLARACAEDFAAHWQVTLRFMQVVTAAWPAFLAEEGMASPAARQAALLDAQAASWTERPPDTPVWAAGMTGATPAIVRLLRVVAGLPHGQVVLPWLDRGLADAALPVTHPQAALLDLLAGLGAQMAEVEDWSASASVPGSRSALLADSLLPADRLHAWRETGAPPPDGLSRLRAADEQEEAVAVALTLRDAIERPGVRAALVTPDRTLAGRVCAELLRWGVVADDSAGETLATTPPAVFLRLVARAVAEDLAPVPLLALLKHPLAAAGLAPVACRQAARSLERALRGPRPPAGFTGLRRALDRHPTPAAESLVERLRDALEPLLRLVPPAPQPPALLLRALVEAAEAMAATPEEPGAARLWRDEEGEALSAVLAEALSALDLLPPQPPSVLPGLLDALLADRVVRTRRALRGRDGGVEHARVFVWGLLEARLQAVDVVVLGGLCEGVWPPATDPGPWLSRPMRDAAGLPSADARIGQAAHDFVMAACSAPVCVLSAPERRDRAPAVPSRWLTRIEARLGHSLPEHPAVAWARALDLPPEGRASPCPAPLPCPPVALRPRRFAVTDIETLIADPFAIYAKRILRLRPLDPLEQETDQLDYGRLVHRGLELFVRQYGPALPPDPVTALENALRIALFEAAVRPAVAAWWAPRLDRIADWVAAEEQRRRFAAVPSQVEVEHTGEWALDGFTLTAKADRIERRADGSLAILDYKTGTPPKRESLHDGSRPQLPLEAAMAQAGAFPGIVGNVTELTYWRLSGGNIPGAAHCPLKETAELADLIADTPGLIATLLAGFDDPTRPYPHRPHPGRTPQRLDYAHLARAGERAAAEDDG